VCGYAYSRDRLLDAETLAKFLAAVPDSHLASSLAELNGILAVVRVLDDQLILAVDRISSMPIFYGSVGSELYVSDDPYWIVEQLPPEPLDELFSAELLLQARVSGRDTLDPRVKQVLAGEVLLAKKVCDRVLLTTERYYRFVHRDYFVEPKETLFARWDAVLRRTFERLISSVNGRTLMVPLSGGYDSRLVAIMLKRLGYENVICFTYGIPGNPQSQLSELVARALGFRWEFVPYTHDLWYDWFHSEQRKECIRYTDGLSAVPLVQDWPAVISMKRHGIVPNGSVFVPGLSMDALAGGLIPPRWWRKRVLDESEVVNEIEKSYGSYWDMTKLFRFRDWKIPVTNIRSKIRNRTREMFAELPCHTAQDAANVLDHYLWLVLTKYYVPALRAYEFWGFDWRLPWWDAEVLTFWERMPLHHRLGKRFYREYVERTQVNSGVQVPFLGGMLPYPQRKYLTRLLRTCGLIDPLTMSGLFKLTERVSHWFHNFPYKKAYHNHPLAWYGMTTLERYGTLHALKPANAYSLLAAERLGLIEL
jgi:asparagine synthase (glutamine-hydrolysing)